MTASAWSVPLWCVMAGHTFVLAAAMGHGSLHDAVLVAAAVTLAMPAGTLFVPAPAGGGVRELVMVLVLATSMPTGDALALTLTSRVVMIAADAALALRTPYPEARLVRADALARLGREDEVRRELDRFLAEAPPALAAERARAERRLSTRSSLLEIK